MAEDILREAQNEVTVEGALLENKLAYKQTAAEGKEYISGDMLIEVSPTNIVPINFFAFRQKKDGQPNKIYAALENVIETYKSTAKHSAENADKVRITGARLESNEFYNAAGQLISTFRVRANFVNRVTAKYNPQANFKVETFIQSMTEEIKDDVPTDRWVITGIIPMYGGRISVLKFYVVSPEGIQYVKNNYSPNDTVKLAGVLDNEVIEIQKTEEMEFGDDIIDTYTRIKRELIVTKGGKPYSEQEQYDTAMIKQGLVQRETNLKEQQQKAMAPPPSSGAFGDDVPF